MKTRKYSRFTYPDGDSWWGDCPRWIAAMRRTGATETRGLLLTRSPIKCIACALGHQH